MKIGVFDSGKGGHFVAQKLQKLMPEHEFDVVDDHEHVPYGDRSEREIIELTITTLQPLLGNTKIIVIACNTATAIAIDSLRETYPDHHFIGYEPMIKPIATMTDHGIVLATAATRTSARYQVLKQAYAHDIRIDEPDTTGWAAMIERGELDDILFDEVAEYIAEGANVISLSCTHYLAIEEKLRGTFPEATVIEPTEAIANRIATIISRL